MTEYNEKKDFQANMVASFVILSARIPSPSCYSASLENLLTFQYHAKETQSKLFYISISHPKVSNGFAEP